MKEKLELFRDGYISKEELSTYLTRYQKVVPIVVTTKHVIHMLCLYQNKAIRQNDLIEWINTIWFSDYFVYHVAEQDSIASVLTRLEEFEDSSDPLPAKIIDDSIMALQNNTILE